MAQRPFPPRPRFRGGAEPSIPWQGQAAVLFLGARRVLAPMTRRLELSGLSWDEMAPVLARIRTIGDWGRQWHREAQASLERGEWRRAAAQAHLGHLPLSPYNPRKTALLSLLRRAHIAERTARRDHRFEWVYLANGKLAGYWETPRNAHRPPVVLLPPLASTKEEMSVLGDPLLAAGHPVLRLDLPGQGESPPPLSITVETLLMPALDELGITADTGYFIGGISLGAYFALRLAGTDAGRVRGAFGVSPPAIITPEQWAKQPEVIWQYLDLYFATETRAETLRLGLSMVLEDVADTVTCPLLLYHATRDFVSLPDRVERYRAAFAHVPLRDTMLDDEHGCLFHLKDVIAPEVAAWCGGISDGRGETDSARSTDSEEKPT